MTSFRSAIFPSLLALCSMHQVYASEMAVSQETSDPSVPAVAPITESQLLLPKSYQHHRPALWSAAALAVKTPRCARFLLGDLQRDRSTLSHPVFRIQCRDQKNLSFAMLIDGLTMRLLDDTRPGGSITFTELQAEIDAENERQRILGERLALESLAEAKQREDLILLRQLEEQKRIEEIRRKQLWDHCQQQLRVKVRNMRELVWLTNEMPEPIEDGGDSLIYYLDFDAEDLYSQKLLYRAECRIAGADDFDIRIRPRSRYSE